MIKIAIGYFIGMAKIIRNSFAVTNDGEIVTNDGETITHTE
jgi:hypothetical protein